MNLLSLQTEIAATLSLNTEDANELALINQWINEGVEYVVAQGQTKISQATAAVDAGEGDYELDTDILRLLWIQTSTTELQPVGPTEILRRRLNASSSAASLYAVDGANLLMLYPIPSGDDMLTIYYVPRPETLTDAADVPSEIPTEFHRLVVKYALWRAADYDDDQTSAQGARYKQELDDGVADMRSRINKKRGRRLGRVSVSRRRGLPHRNDIYPS